MAVKIFRRQPPPEPRKAKRASPKRLPTYLEPEELAALLAGAAGRERLLFLLCARAGLRAFEVVKIRHEDIIWLAGQPTQLRLIGKRNKEALLPLALSTRVLLHSFTSSGQRGWLFAGRCDGQHLSQRAAAYWMAAICRQVGISRSKAHLHALRHSFATHLLRQGVSLKEVQELMRHDNIATTSIYLHTTPERLQQAVDRLDAAG